MNRKGTAKISVIAVSIVSFSFFLVFFFNFIGVFASPDWWDSNWQKRMNVTINNTDNPNALSNYQVAINVTPYDSDMQTDFDDLRFVDSDDSTQLSYWIESKSDSNWAYVWVNITSIPASSTKDIYMYYDNSGVSTTGNADSVFDVYSNFTCTSDPCIDADLYNSTNTVAYQSGGKSWANTTSTSGYATMGITNALPENHSLISKFNVASISGSLMFMVSNTTYPEGGWGAAQLDPYLAWRVSTDGTMIQFLYINTTENLFQWNFTSHDWQTSVVGYTTDIVGITFYLELRRNQTHVFMGLYNSTKDLIEEATALRSVARFGNVPVYWFYGDMYDDYQYGNVSVDDLIVRKYQTPEPTYSFGDEEEGTTGNLVLLQYPTDSSYNDSLTIDFGYKPVFHQSIQNCSLYTNETSWSLKETNTSAVTNNSINLIQETFGSEDTYIWNVGCFNSTHEVFASTNWTITIDTAKPTITVQYPENTTYGTSSVWCNVTVDEPASWCGRSLDSGSNVTMINSTGNWNNLMTGLSETTHNVKVYCNDTAGNMNVSETVYFTVGPTDYIIITADNTAKPINQSQNISFSFIHDTGGNPFYNCWVEVELPSDTKVGNFTASHSGSTCSYNYTHTYWNGTWDYRLFVNDTAGNVNYNSSTISVVHQEPKYRGVYLQVKIDPFAPDCAGWQDGIWNDDPSPNLPWCHYNESTIIDELDWLANHNINTIILVLGYPYIEWPSAKYNDTACTDTADDGICRWSQNWLIQGTREASIYDGVARNYNVAEEWVDDLVSEAHARGMYVGAALGMYMSYQAVIENPTWAYGTCNVTHLKANPNTTSNFPPGQATGYWGCFIDVTDSMVKDYNAYLINETLYRYGLDFVGEDKADAWNPGSSVVANWYNTTWRDAIEAYNTAEGKNVKMFLLQYASTSYIDAIGDMVGPDLFLGVPFNYDTGTNGLYTGLDDNPYEVWTFTDAEDDPDTASLPSGIPGDFAMWLAGGPSGLVTWQTNYMGNNSRNITVDAWNDYLVAGAYLPDSVKGSYSNDALNVTVGTPGDLTILLPVNQTVDGDWGPQPRPTLNNTINETIFIVHSNYLAKNSTGYQLGSNGTSQYLFWKTNSITPGTTITNTLYWDVECGVNTSKNVINSTAVNITISENGTVLSSDYSPTDIGLFYNHSDDLTGSISVFNDTGSNITDSCVINSTHTYISVGSLSSYTYTVSSSEEEDETPPTYSLNSTNSTVAGTPVEHRLKWTDETGLATSGGYVFSFCNGTWNGTDCLGGNPEPPSDCVHCVWISCGNDLIYRVDLSNLTHSLESWDNPNSTSSPFGVEYIDGWIYYVDYGEDVIYKLSQAGAYQAEYDITGFGAGAAYGLCANSTHFFIPDKTNDLMYITTIADPTVSLTNFSIDADTEGCFWRESDDRIYTVYAADFVANYSITGTKDATQWELNDSIGAPTAIIWADDYWWISDDADDLIYKLSQSDLGNTLFTASYDDASSQPQGLAYFYNTGSWVNDTWTAFSANPDWSNVTKTINSTVGATVAWCVYANDTSNNWNGTSCVSPFSYETTLALTPTEVKLYLNETEVNQTLTYGDISNITAEINVTGLFVDLYLNGTLINNDTDSVTNITDINWFANATYNITASYPGNETYDADSETLYVFVNKGTSNATLTVTPSTPITYETQSNATCTEDSPEASGNLYRNGTLKNAENDTLIYLPADTWQYICNVSQTENYTSATDSQNYVINKKDADVQVYPTTQTVTYPTEVTQYCVDSSSLLDCSIFRNDSSISNNTVITLGASVYVYKANITDQSNYTNYQDTETLTINKGATTTNLLLNGTDEDKEYDLNDVANFTVLNVSGTVKLDSNYTGWVLQSGASPLMNYTTLATTGDWWNLTGYFEEDANYTASSDTHFFNVTGGNGGNGESWWNSSWKRRANVTINNTDNSNVLTDYQVPINVTFDSDMQTDFDDLRFIDSDDSTELYYWIESKTDSSWAYVWTNITSIPASSTKDIIMYYDNDAVSTTSSGDNTFDVYSNFTCPADPCIDSDLYNYTNAMAYQSGGKAWTNTTANEDYAVIGATNALPENHSVKLWFSMPTLEGIALTLYKSTYPSGGLSSGEMEANTSVRIGQNADGMYLGYWNTTPSTLFWNFTTHTWGASGYYPASAGDEFYVSGKRNQTHIILELYNSTNALIDSAPISRGTVQNGNDPLYWFFGDIWDNNHYENASIDDLIVRKYQTPEPSYSIGSEELLSIIRIDSPTNTTYTYSSIDFNFTVVSDEDSTFHVKAYNNSASEFYDNASYSNNTLMSFPLSKSDGSYYVKVWANESTNDPTEETVYYTVDTTPPYIEVQLPNGTYIFNLTDTKEVSLNHTVSDASYCWYSLNSGSNTSISGCSNTTVVITEARNNTLAVYVNDSGGLENSSSTDFFTDFENEFRAIDAETSEYISSFSILFDNVTNQTYESTESSLITVNTTELPYGTSVSAKYVATGYNDTWATYNINSTAHLNETEDMILSMIWVKVYDEETLENLTFNITIVNATHSESWGGETTFYKNWTDVPYNEITISVQNMTGGYTERDYYRTLDESTSVNLTAYLLKTTSGWIVRFHIRTTSDIPIPNATVSAYEFIEDSWQLIQQETSDGAGTATMFLEPLTSYRITASVTGYAESTQTITPSSQDYRLYLSVEEEEVYEDVFYDVSWLFTPTVSTVENETTFVLNISSNESVIEFYGLNITQVNVTGTFELYFANITDQPAGGDLNPTLNLTGTNGTIYIIGWFKHQDYPVEYWNTSYRVGAEAGIMPGLLEHVGSILSGTAAGIVSILMSLAAGGMASKFIKPYGLVGGGIVALIVLGVCVFIGWFDWLLFGLIAMAVVALIFVRGRM